MRLVSNHTVCRHDCRALNSAKNLVQMLIALWYQAWIPRGLLFVSLYHLQLEGKVSSLNTAMMVVWKQQTWAKCCYQSVAGKHRGSTAESMNSIEDHWIMNIKLEASLAEFNYVPYYTIITKNFIFITRLLKKMAFLDEMRILNTI